AVAAVLDLKEQQGCSVGEALTANLAGRQLLLILDNCEHLLETCGALVVELLQAAADVRILATSREPLGVDGEHVYSLPHMIVPTCQQLSTEELAGCEAVQLFIDRATAALHGFTLTPERCAAISEICRRLDGMPLAIEIAAAMVKVLPVEEINARLGQSLRVLTRGSKSAPPRHRTLRATIEWSHALLTDVERTLFRRLAVFAGGWTLDAAEQVCAGESIEKWEVLDRFTRLVDKSLVEMDVERTEQAGRGRYRMLETVREYAAERLEESGEADRVRSRYRDYFLDLAHQAAAHKMDAAQVDWLSRLEREHDNLRAILDRAMLESTTGSDDPDWSGLRLAGDLGWYWDIRGLWTEGRRYLEALLRRPGAAARIPARALGLFWCGELARVAGDLDRARELLEQSLELRIELGDHAGAAASLNDLGNIANMCGDHELARRCYEDGLTYRRQIDDRLGIAVSLNNLGTLAWSRQDAETAVAYLGESLTLRRDLGDLRGVAGTLHNLGLIASARDDHAAARVHLIEATEIRRTLGDTAGLGRALLALSTVALKENDLDTARSLREESRTTFRELGDRFGSALAAVGLGVVLSRQGELERAQELFEESLALWRKGGDRRRVLETLISIAEVAADQGRPDRVHDALDEALSIARQLQDPGPTAGPLRAVAYLELDGDEPETAVILLGASESMREQAGLGLPADGAAQRDGALAEARARLGEAAADRAWATGRSMTAEDAIALAESRIVLRRPGRAPRRRG
ncbi:MAG: tetratricopeptide repeat protein, partial [Candidatus Eiseniibacteriota bacterium]